MSLLREAERCVVNQTANSSLNAFVTRLQRPRQWRDKVVEADLRREQGKPLSVVDGKLIAIKDNICTRELPTTCASGTLLNFTSPFNATVVEQLQSAGAVITGKTNLDEFGMGSYGVNSRFGSVKSHMRRGTEDVCAGGSSSGSAVAVATDQCYAALGTDTGGSVRLPAAYTGTVGLKPSYGLVSRWGVVAYANSLDTVGIIGRNTSTVRDVFNILNQHDPRDPTNLSPASRSRILSHLLSADLKSRTSSSRPLTIGVPIEYNISELAPSVRSAWLCSLNHLKSQGFTLHPVSLPATKQALSSYYVLAPAEASSNLAKYDGVRYGTRAVGPDSDAGRPTDGHLYAKTRGEGFGAEVKRRILLGTFSLSAAAMDNYFLQAQRVRRLVQRDFDRVFRAPNPLAAASCSQQPASHLAATEERERISDPDSVDVLVCPTAPSLPPLLRDVVGPDAVSSPLDAYVNDVFTVPASLAGLPAVSVPVFVEAQGGAAQPADLTGIQVIGQYGDDELVLKVGELLEGQSFQWPES